MASSIETKSTAAADKSENEPFWTGGRIAITVIGLALIAWWGIAEWRTSKNPNTVVATIATDNPVTTANPAAPPPAFVAMPQPVRDANLKTLDGESLKLSDFSQKVVVVNIWATWCGPCRLEMPELVKMSNEYKSRGLVVVGVASAYQETVGQVKDFVHDQNIPYKVVFDDGSLEGPLVEAVQGRSVIPQSFVISREGNIVKHFTGYDPTRTPRLMREAIEEALDNKGKA
ncbi:MAG TPA: TlpA disulfide reductase family protein [Pyrinomonadaceae bacterium]|nr:TlpA disulfide reductase family protein [Pyrinomonadaceae bacterium]